MPIHVLHLIDGLNVGGAEMLLCDLTSGLSEHGFRISVGYCTPGPLVKYFTDRNIPAYHLPRSGRVDPFLVWKMVSLIRSDFPQIVHTHLFKSDFHGRLAARIAGVPVVISTLHNADGWAKQWPLGPIYGSTAVFTDKLIAVSDDVKKYHIEITKVPENKVIVIENGIQVQKFHDPAVLKGKIRAEFNIDNDILLFGIIARLKPQKDHVTFLKAASLILKKLPNARFLIIGDGPLHSDLQELAAELNISRAVIFTGLRDDIVNILAEIDVLVFSSVWEGLPVTLLEGMAAGKPVAGTKISGIDGPAVDQETALLVPVKDPEALAKVCIQLGEDPGLRRRFGIAGFERVSSKYNLDHMIENTASLYRSELLKHGIESFEPVNTAKAAVIHE